MDLLSQVHCAREEYMTLHPSSDLAEVLNGRKSLADARRDTSEH
jgi:hypothetical protein